MDSAALDDRVRERAGRLDRIRRELGRISAQGGDAEAREEFLGEICKWVNLGEIRRMLQMPKVDEEEFLGKIREVD